MDTLGRLRPISCAAGALGVLGAAGAAAPSTSFRRGRLGRGFWAIALAAALVLSAGRPLRAQTASPPAASPPAAAPSTPKSVVKKRNPTGSPLDTLMNAKLWPDVPEAKDFVREARPDPDSLEYQPTWGAEPERPKPRSSAELEQLRQELDSAGARNKARGRSSPPASPQSGQ